MSDIENLRAEHINNLIEEQDDLIKGYDDSIEKATTQIEKLRSDIEGYKISRSTEVEKRNALRSLQSDDGDLRSRIFNIRQRD